MDYKFEKINLDKDIEKLKEVVTLSFSQTEDSNYKEWFSFKQMYKSINENIGVCIKATNNIGEIVGLIYAEQENPINAIEGTEKWVISILAIIPELTGKQIGSNLILNLETYAKTQNVKKIFVYTNMEDSKVINFYKNNNYKEVGYIKGYQGGDTNNDAIFLLKYL
ncbi:MAG: GNAT family N-acetyltransferase [Nanoarchaeales archaeon]|nr:GNAT family N-acetyltransferase [Nanoarchaeales archaeon]